MALTKEDLQAISELIEPVRRDINNIQVSLEDIQLTLENETNRNIKLIAEGHLDLSRKLDNALKVESEKEMLMIRVNILENEFRKIKARFEIA